MGIFQPANFLNFNSQSFKVKNLNTLTNSAGNSGIILASVNLGTIDRNILVYTWAGHLKIITTAVTNNVTFTGRVTVRDTTQQASVTVAQQIAAGHPLGQMSLAFSAATPTTKDNSFVPTFPGASQQYAGNSDSGATNSDDYGNAITNGDSFALDIGLTANQNVANQTGTFNFVLFFGAALP